MNRAILIGLLGVLALPAAMAAESAGGDDIPDAVVKKVDPSVVAIMHERSAGSGFVVSADGLILSNGHVVKGSDGEDPTEPAKSVTVILHDERKFPAKVLGFCMNPDVALLKIDAGGPLRPVEFGDSRSAQIGQTCFAVGTPVGLKRTFTRGILSNVDRTDLGTFTKVFQTDAAINPGNSGGPLFDRNGRVLGINTYASRGSNNLGFTIPTHVVQVLLAHLQEHGRFVRADLPFFFAGELYDELAAALEAEKGILVSYVMAGTPAEEAGLQAGDIITAIDGEPVSARTRAEMMEIEWEFVIRKPGTPVRLTVMRGEPGMRQEVVIEGMMEEDEPTPNTNRFPGEIMTRRYDSLGLGYKRLVRAHRVMMGLPDDLGVLVSKADPDSAAQRAGLNGGDIVTAVAGRAVTGVASFQAAIESALAGCPRYVEVTVRRRKALVHTMLKPFYDLRAKRVAVVAPGASEHLETVLRELATQGAQIQLVADEVPAVSGAITRTALAELNGGEVDVLVLVDGDRAKALWEDAEALRVVREAAAAERILGAIGAAALTLVVAEPTLLEKKITTSRDCSAEALKRKAQYTGSDVEKDGKVVTSTGLDRGVVREFMKALRVVARGSG